LVPEVVIYTVVTGTVVVVVDDDVEEIVVVEVDVVETVVEVLVEVDVVELIVEEVELVVVGEVGVVGFLHLPAENINNIKQAHINKSRIFLIATSFSIEFFVNIIWLFRIRLST